MHRQIALDHHMAGKNLGQSHLRAQSRARQQGKQKQISQFQDEPRGNRVLEDLLRSIVEQVFQKESVTRVNDLHRNSGMH
jgi:hypothetical protein